MRAVGRPRELGAEWLVRRGTLVPVACVTHDDVGRGIALHQTGT